MPRPATKVDVTPGGANLLSDLHDVIKSYEPKTAHSIQYQAIYGFLGKY
jgi:hypothetical protein